MKTRNREVNVFSMSALDLFASALGAFILISIVLMPYFLRLNPEDVADLRRELRQEQNTSAELRRRLDEAQNELQRCRQQEAACREDLAALQQEVDQAQAELAEAREDLQQTQSELQQCQANLDVCEEKLSKTFLAIVIQWPTEIHDVDLHVIDPAGERFYYRNKGTDRASGQLSADTTNGPGVEIWELAEARVGEYKVLYNFYSNRDGDEVNMKDAVVKGGVYHRDGHHPLGERTLTTVHDANANAVPVATVTVKEDGSVDISQR